MSDYPILTISVAGGLRHSLEPGDRLTFGRSDDGPEGGSDVDPDEPRSGAAEHLGLSDNPRLHRLAGAVEVDDAGWLLTNTGRWLHLRVVELDGPNRVELHPGRLARIPFPRCRVEVMTGDETVGFEAACPWLAEPGSAVSSGGGPGADRAVPLSGATVGGLGLDREAGYFRALVALCAPRLRNPQVDEVSSIGEIVRLLNALPGETEKVTAKAVEHRLAHVRRKVGLASTDPYGGSTAGLEQRDAGRQLADLVLRTGTVTPADLHLVDPTATTGTGVGTS